MVIGDGAPTLEQRLRAPVEHEHVEVEPRAEASWKAFTPSASRPRSPDPYCTSPTSTQHPLPVESTTPRLGRRRAADQTRVEKPSG